MEEELGTESVLVPDRLACLAELPKVADLLPPEEQALQDWVQNNL